MCTGSQHGFLVCMPALPFLFHMYAWGFSVYALVLSFYVLPSSLVQMHLFCPSARVFLGQSWYLILIPTH